METWNFSEMSAEDDHVIRDFSVNPPNVYGFGHQAYYDHVVDAILNNKKQLVDGLEGHEVLKLLMQYMNR